MKVNVVRAFLIQGKRQEVGSEVDLSDRFAMELIAAGKVSRAGPAPAGPQKLTAESAAALVPGVAPESDAAKALTTTAASETAAKERPNARK